MKTIFKKTATVILFLSAILFIGVSCDNDSNPSPNDETCENPGLTWVDNSNNTNIFISDDQLSTQFFPNVSNGPFGAPGVEIAGQNSNGDRIFFVTNIIQEGQSGSGSVELNGGQSQPVTVTCQRAGTNVGEEFRYDIIFNSLELEFCVKIDQVL